ncbi:TIGR04283 family arsenosugar biosynthesis glycosyltransferase [soil metagenome]
MPALRTVHEVIVAEASPEADSPQGENVTALLCVRPSRGKQMNDGAAVATGDVLAFLHADTEIELPHVEAMGRALADSPRLVGGAFYRQFDERHPRLRWLETVARFLTRNGGTLFGDQTVFVRREVFEQLGGFAEIPLMEDVEFSRRLRARGPVAVLDPPIRTSPRHHLENGAWRTTIRNGLFLLLFKLGVSAETLHSIYYARRGGVASAQSTSSTSRFAREVR